MKSLNENLWNTLDENSDMENCNEYCCECYGSDVRSCDSKCDACILL